MKAFKKAFGKTKAPEASGHKPTPDAQSGAYASTAVHAVAGLSLEPSHARTSDDADSAECGFALPQNLCVRNVRLSGRTPCRICTSPQPPLVEPEGGVSPARREVASFPTASETTSKVLPHGEHSRGADAKYGLADAFPAISGKE